MLKEGLPKIHVGSTSPIKIKAVESVFVGHQVIGHNAKSGVGDQPMGILETRKGATNRCFEVVVEGDSIAIGIENGMWQAYDGTWVDGACIIMMKDNVYHEFWSETIDIPDDHPRGENGQWSKYKDPHMMICGKSRTQFLSEAIAKYCSKKK